MAVEEKREPTPPVGAERKGRGTLGTARHVLAIIATVLVVLLVAVVAEPELQLRAHGLLQADVHRLPSKGARPASALCTAFSWLTRMASGSLSNPVTS